MEGKRGVHIGHVAREVGETRHRCRRLHCGPGSETVRMDGINTGGGVRRGERPGVQWGPWPFWGSVVESNLFGYKKAKMTKMMETSE